DADCELLRRVPSIQPAPAVQVDQRAEALKTAADDSDHQWKAQHPGTCERLRRATDAKPHGQALLMWARENSLPRERRAEAPLPREVGLLAKLEEEVKLLREEIVIVPHLETEQWIGLAERTASNDDFGTALRNQVQGCELLKYAHRISGAQDRNC